MAEKVMTALGSKVQLNSITKGTPPLVLQAQLDGYVVLQTPEELRQWQEDLLTTTGLQVDASGLAGIAAETCTGGSSDACDKLQ
jgi:hypothetical protein